MNFTQKYYSREEKEKFLRFLGILSGLLVKCKELHWAAPKKNIHVYLDEFHEILGDIQDTIAEGYMGILGKMKPGEVPFYANNATDAISFIEDAIKETKDFYEDIPPGTEFKGLTSETETFINNCYKYRYLFSLCSNDYDKN